MICVRTCESDYANSMNGNPHLRQEMGSKGVWRFSSVLSDGKIKL